MFALINAFLQDQGVNVLFKSEFNHLVVMAVDGNKAATVMFLKEKTMKITYKTWVLDEREDYPAAITTWIKHNNMQAIPGTEREVRLDLKTAKEVVEFIMNNREHVNS